jgi:hypothetical protein
MTPEEKAREIALRIGEDEVGLLSEWTEIIATAIRDARNAALEEAAGVANAYWETTGGGIPFGPSDDAVLGTSEEIANCILALKDKP